MMAVPPLTTHAASAGPGTVEGFQLTETSHWPPEVFQE